MAFGIFRRASEIDDVAPFFVALRLRLEKRAERDDLPATLARFLDGVNGQRLADPFSAQSVRHAGMVDDDQFRRCTRIGHFGLVAFDFGDIAPAGLRLFVADFYVRLL